jgi:transposase InsO family protein
MTQAAAQLHPSAFSLQPSEWIPVGEAAIKLGLNVGHLRRRCATDLSRDGLARQLNGSWHVHVGMDQRLRRPFDAVQRDLAQMAELVDQGVKPRYIELAESRRDIVVGLAAFRLKYPSLPPRGLREMYLGHLSAEGLVGPNARVKHLSITQLYEWERQYTEEGLAGLVPAAAFAGPVDRDAVGSAALARIKMLLDCGNRISLAAAIAIAKGEALDHDGDAAWRIGSYSSVRLAVAAARPKIMRTLADRGDRAARADCIPKMQRDFDSIAAGDEYVGDERTLDIWCRVLTSRGWRAIRPKLTCWNDMRSRMVVGWHLGRHASSRTILAALKSAIRDHGKPLILRTDWGEDYKAAARHGEVAARASQFTRRGGRPESTADGQHLAADGVFSALGIEVRRTGGPYTPWAKPIESFFKTLKDHLDKLFGGFWGGCPSERHEDRGRFIRDNLEKLPTVDDIAAALSAFFDLYHHTPHSAVDLFGKSPLQAMAAFRSGPVRAETDAVLDLLFRQFTKPKLVRRDGVRHDGHWYGNGDARLVPMQGRQVILAFQPDDMGRALVCRLDKTPLFEIECPPRHGLAYEESRERHAEQRRMIRPYKEQAREARQWLLGQSPEELLALRAKGLGVAARAHARPESPRLTVARPALESAIAAAGPAPSAAASKALRTGTDDDSITLDDMLGGTPVGPVSRPVNDDPPGEVEGLNWGDMTGEF